LALHRYAMRLSGRIANVMSEYAGLIGVRIVLFFVHLAGSRGFESECHMNCHLLDSGPHDTILADVRHVHSNRTTEFAQKTMRRTNVV
jgi:hypothetical protein